MRSPLFDDMQDDTVTGLKYVPLSEARKVALYMLFFTWGDSLSNTAMVVICPFTGSILSQLAGSDNFVYLQKERATHSFFLYMKLRGKNVYFAGLVPNATSESACILHVMAGKPWLTLEVFLRQWLRRPGKAVLGAGRQETAGVGVRAESRGARSLYCGLWWVC